MAGRTVSELAESKHLTKTTLITGAAHGLGRAITDHLRGLGHRIIGIGRTPEPDFDGELHLADLADEDATAAVLKDILDRHEIDNLVNNAGVGGRMLLADLTMADLNRILQVNVRAAFQCAQAVLPGMTARGQGRIVNISSLSMLGVRNQSAYSASKAALGAMTRSWALEYADKGIAVNLVAPGAIAGGMFGRRNPPGSAVAAMVQGMVPMQRLGKPEEVAAAVAYFLSPDAAYTTGQTLFVCGAWSLTDMNIRRPAT